VCYLATSGSGLTSCGIVRFLLNDVAVVSSKPRHDFVMSPAEPTRHVPIPAVRVGNDRHRWISAPSSGEHDAARPLPVDDLFLPPELDLVGVATNKSDANAQSAFVA
jgi:hypothetical protein